MESPTTTVTLRPFSFLILFYLYLYLYLYFFTYTYTFLLILFLILHFLYFLRHYFWDLLLIIWSPWQCYIICHYNYYIRLYHFHQVKENFISVLSSNCFIVLSFIAVFNWVTFGSLKLIFFDVYFIIIFQLSLRKKMLVIGKKIF